MTKETIMLNKVLCYAAARRSETVGGGGGGGGGENFGENITFPSPRTF